MMILIIYLWHHQVESCYSYSS